jgi:PAS domain S-box-containing protein
MRRAQEAAEAASRALERSLERLQLALDGANVALWDWNVIENRTYYSEGWARMLGLSPEEVGDSVEIWERLIHPEDKLIATQKLAAHVAGLSDRYQAEFRLRTKEGGWRWIQARGKVVARAADGSPTRVAGTHLDITEHKQLQNTLAEARDAALAGSRAKSAFLANMSHEIRTPLNAILGYSQLMMRDPSLGRAATDKLNIINRSGEHLLALINGILDLSKIEAGRMELNAVQFDAADLLEGLAAMFRLRAEAKGLQLGINVDGEWAKHVVADQGKVRQVLINLLGNAVKFTKRGSIQARVSVGRRKDNQLWLSAEVEDTGTGIAPEEQTELFRPFVQTQSGVELRSGTGLGLAISKEFVRMMGGKITVKSEAGKGSTFRFEIPVQAGSEDSIPLQPVDRRVIGLVPAGPAPRVLIVDDQQHNRGWLSALLTSIGLAVCEADSGPAALRLWQEWKPQLILMDIRMPGMDGLETTRAIRASSNGEQPVVIALTASARHADRQAILQSGIDDVLSKPCGEADLLEKIRAHLKIEYVYADQDTSGLEAPHAAQPPALGPEFLTELPGELIDKLKGAVLMGDKERLNELVRRVADKDTRAARVLQRLADSYEYDALTRLFEQVVAHQVVT